MIPSLHISLLGEFLLVSGDVPITTVDWPRLQSLLAYLMLHRNAPQSRTRLAFLLWPDSTETQAHTNLRQLLHRLRNTLPNADHFLHIEKQTLQWQPNATWTFDVADFEAAIAQANQAEQVKNQTAMRQAFEKAVNLYHGDLLPSCYDEWLMPERERLRQMFFDALERLILLLERERNYQSAISFAQRLLRHDLLHEATYRQLMQLYSASGDRAAALRTYHTCVTVLERELATEPVPATREAYERLMQADALSSPQKVLVSLTPLVGRQQEWAQLQDAWRQACRERPQMVLLAGEAGIGKTRLAEELLTWVGRQGLITAEARCYAAEGELAYAPVASWLRTEILRKTLIGLSDTWLIEVGRLIPDILRERPDLPHPGPLTESWQRQHLFEALARAILQARQPLLLFLDDLQWCDRETLEWLHYLLRFEPQARFLLIGTARPEEMAIDHPLALLLKALRREGQVIEVALLPLNAVDASTLAGHVAGLNLDSALAINLYQETEGNPLFIVEMARMGIVRQKEKESRSSSAVTNLQVSKLPSTVQAVIAARLEQLSPMAHALMCVAAVIGRAFDFNVLVRASGDEEDNIVRGLDELWQRRIVREQGSDAYDFSHDKLRQGAYTALSAARRRLLHRRVAQALEEVYANNLDTVSGQIATHYERANLSKQAIPYYRRAAEGARHVYANDMAIDYYRHLLPLLEKQEKGRGMLALGTVMQLTGQWTEAEATYLQALSIAGLVGDLHTQAQIQQALGDVIRLRGSYDAALEWLEQARIGFEQLGDQQGLIRALWTMGEVYWYQGNFAQALVVLERQMQLATVIGDQRGMCDAAGTMGIVYWSQGDYPQALACCEQSIQIAKEIDHQFAVNRAALTIGNVNLSEGNYTDALAWYVQALQVAGDIGDRQGVCFAITNIGNVYLERGEYSRGLKCFEHALQMEIELGDRWSANIALMNISEVFLKQKRFREAESWCVRGIALARALDIPPFLCLFLHFTADLYTRQQRYAEAERLNTEALQLSIQVGNANLGVENVLLSIEVLSIRLRAALHQIDASEAINELERLLVEQIKDTEQAVVQYEIWRLDHAQELYRQNAADLYRTMSARIPNIDYRQRYEELTGEQLPDPPPLPELPEMILNSRVDLEALIVQIDQAVRDEQFSKA